jgi:2-iminoacetate synthase ThiH
MINAGANVTGVLLEKGVLDAGLEDREAKKELSQLFEKNFVDLAAEADGIRRRLHPNDIVTYIVDRNINYTNVCWVACSFCAFYRTKRQAQNGDGYILSTEQVLQKIQETVDLGGTGILMQGGLHPDIGMEYTTDLFRAIRRSSPRYRSTRSPRRRSGTSSTRADCPWKRPSRSSKRPG